jgi:HAD superfamily hydrolase (TIGR01490 family)
MAALRHRGGGSRQPRRAAFFDVDETLITVKSMFRFLEFHLAQRGMPPAVYERVRDDLAELAARGRTRQFTNRAYYRVYANQRAAQITAQARAWFATELANGGLFVDGVLSALRGHTAAGDLVVLVSGSFPPCVEPIARHVGADLVVCTSPEIVDGVYTGRVERPVIGQAKADAAREILAEHGIRAEDSHAYGDHASDLMMLREVGHPVVVGDDPILAVIAEEAGWRTLPGATGPHTPVSSSLASPSG